MLAKLRSIYRRALFDDSLLGFFLNPSYIARSRIYKALGSQAKKFKGLNVLDVGCGAKPYARLFHQSKSYIGIDTNLSGHDHNGEAIDVLYDGKMLPFDSFQFDGVVSFQVLEHVQDLDLSFSEIHRVLKDEGVLLLTVPFCWCEHEKPYDFRRFTSFGLHQLCRLKGFEILELKKTTNYLQTLAQLLNTYLASSLKTPWAILNIGLNILFVAPINFLGIYGGMLSKNNDLFCDLVVIARKTKIS